jgi:hypothetical protein
MKHRDRCSEIKELSDMFLEKTYFLRTLTNILLFKELD